MRGLLGGWLGLALIASAGCGGSNASSAAPPSDSEVATSVVGGALNNMSGNALGWNGLPRPRKSVLDRVLDQINPIGSAYAASWTCTGGTLVPTFAGPSGNPYAFTPVSCAVTYANAKTSSSTWSGSFTLDYGSSCDGTHAWIGNQSANCSVTRTTAAGGNTRTITGPNGSSYAITHDTHGAGTGWDSTVSPAPNDDGIVATCGANGCSSSSGGGTLIINGSHLTGTVALSGHSPSEVWDHTVSTGATPLTVTGSGTTRLVSGTVTVQHNLARYTATSTFEGVGFGEARCCFPTTGTVTTTFNNGSNAGKTETLTFSAVCGEATLANASGSTVGITLLHCL